MQTWTVRAIGFVRSPFSEARIFGLNSRIAKRIVIPLV